jgi:hypothetical protein
VVGVLFWRGFGGWLRVLYVIVESFAVAVAELVVGVAAPNTVDALQEDLASFVTVVSASHEF